MRWLSTSAYYVKSLFRRRKLDAQLSEEIQSHVDMATEANVAAGMSPEEARYAALREFGNVASVQEQTRDEHGWVWLEQLTKDFGFAVRSLVRARGFSLTVIGNLVLGIALAMVVFPETRALLFPAPSYPEPEQLVLIGTKNKGGTVQNVCAAVQFQACREQTKIFSGFAAVEQSFANVVVDDSPEAKLVLKLSAESRQVLGIKLSLGRFFRPEEFRPGAENVAIISDWYWREKFLASPEVLGRQIKIDEQSCTVIGVLAPDQTFPGGVDGYVYRPLIVRAEASDPLSQWLCVIGRLQPGMSREQAAAALALVKLNGLPAWADSFFADRKMVLSDLDANYPAKPFLLLQAGGFLLYAIALLNAMNLMLSRLLGRRRELGIRLALGGSRWQIARLLLIETFVLTFTAGLVVSVMWFWLYPQLYALLSGGAITFPPDHAWWAAWKSALGPAFVFSVLSSVAVALVPVWRVLKSGVNAALKEGGPAHGESRRMARLRQGLVVFQAALAVMLLIGSGLMLRSFERLYRIDLGFDPAGKVKVQVRFPRDFQPKPETSLQLFESLAQRLAVLPGVKGVAYGQQALLDGEWQGEQLKLADGTVQWITGHWVSVDFARVAGLRMVEGRWFAGRTAAKTSSTEVVINETMARQLFGGRDPVGQVIPDRPLVVVGVVRDVKGAVREAVGMHYYVPTWWVRPQNLSMFYLRMEADPPKEFGGLVQRAIYAVEPKLIVANVSSIAQSIKDSMWSENFAYMALRVLAPCALGLAAIGMFSVLAYNVGARRQEFGVRLALGATPADIRRLVLRRGLAVAAVGIAIGTAVSIGLTRFMQSLLFETTPNDPLVYAGVAVVMLSAAVLACWLPARRAAKADPIVALRAE